MGLTLHSLITKLRREWDLWDVAKLWAELSHLKGYPADVLERYSSSPVLYKGAACDFWKETHG